MKRNSKIKKKEKPAPNLAHFDFTQPIPPQPCTQNGPWRWGQGGGLQRRFTLSKHSKCYCVYWWCSMRLALLHQILSANICSGVETCLSVNSHAQLQRFLMKMFGTQTGQILIWLTKMSPRSQQAFDVFFLLSPVAEAGYTEKLSVRLSVCSWRGTTVMIGVEFYLVDLINKRLCFVSSRNIEIINIPFLFVTASNVFKHTNCIKPIICQRGLLYISIAFTKQIADSAFHITVIPFIAYIFAIKSVSKLSASSTF